MHSFFSDSSYLETDTVRHLRHMDSTYELIWDSGKRQYQEDDNIFAQLLNSLIKEIGATKPAKRYHRREDIVASYVVTRLRWAISKKEKYWVGAEYDSILEQGGFDDIDERNLVLAAAGRVMTARDHGQNHYDHMEESHRRMLGTILRVILYHRFPLNS